MSNTLIVGGGPVAIQLAQICSQMAHQTIDMVSRVKTSASSQRVYNAYQRDGYFKVTTQNAAHQQLSGEFKVRQFYKDIQEVSSTYNTLIMACTADAYRSILNRLAKATVECLQHIVLVSPTLGSHMVIEQLLSELNLDVEVVSFSTYLGDTRVVDTTQPHQVLTSGVKSKLYVGSTHTDSRFIDRICVLFHHLNIQIAVMDTPLHAEVHNSSLYVHPALFMNDFSLQAVFKGTTVPVYVYKLFPEGPITMKLIREMRQMWVEMMKILNELRVPSVNLLKFMVKENYPVRPETLSEREINQFEDLPAIHQEYLLYVRYTAILIDPFSEPDSNGHYFDFSAVPYKRLYIDEEGVTHIPRMPSEDSYRTAMIQAVGRALNVKTPMIDQFLARYRSYCDGYRAEHPKQSLSVQFDSHQYEEDIALVKQFLKNKTEHNGTH